MASEVYSELAKLVRMRENTTDISEMEEMSRLYEGELPARYAEYFPQNSPKHVVNLIRLAWDDLATSVGRLPDLRGEPQNSTDTELRRVGLLERIGHSYLDKAAPSGRLFMFQLAWWLVGTGRSVVIVRPDEKEKSPIPEVRDPRTCYPGIERSVGGQIVELSDLVFKYELPAEEMARRGLAVGNKVDQFGRETGEKKQTGTVMEYVDKEWWVLASDGGSVQRARHGLGVVPGFYFNTFSPNKDGLSQFQDQVTFMVAISQMISMKMAFIERTVYPVTWVRGHQGKIKIGPHVINKLGPQGEMGQLTPPAQLQTDRDIAQLERYSRILNRNPEVRQGEIQSKGTYTSAKTLEQLSDAIDTVIGRMWDVVGTGLQQILRVCFRMDEELWPNESKSISGIRKGSRYRDTYRPSRDIAGRHYLKVDYGFGLGGYQGFLQTVQANQAGLLPKRRAIEEMPGVSDVDQVMRELEIESMDEAGKVMFQTQAAQGGLDMVLWSTLRKRMEEDGTPLHEIILEYQEELQRQAQASQQQPGAAEALTVPGGEEVPPEAALPGVPPLATVGF